MDPGPLAGEQVQYVAFGRTGLRVSRLSMGCNRLGDPGVDPDHWSPIVRRAIEHGVTLFDTSSNYNDGRSEAILGEITGRPTANGPSALLGVVVATKGGAPSDALENGVVDFSAEGIRASAERSLRRLRRDVIDLYMLHSPTTSQLATESWPTAIDELKSERKIRYFGISTSDHASGVWAIEHGADFLQIEYDILNPMAEEELLPFARQRDVGIMVRTPLARGLLTGKFPADTPLPAHQQWRRPTGSILLQKLRRVEQIRFLERKGQTLGQAALRWLLAQPGVHCVIPGARTIEQLNGNVESMNGELTEQELQKVQDLQGQWKAEARQS